MQIENGPSILAQSLQLVAISSEQPYPPTTTEEFGLDGQHGGAICGSTKEATTRHVQRFACYKKSCCNLQHEKLNLQLCMAAFRPSWPEMTLWWYSLSIVSGSWGLQAKPPRARHSAGQAAGSDTSRVTVSSADPSYRENAGRMWVHCWLITIPC